MQKHTKLTRVIAVVLSVLMLMSVFTIVASAEVERTEYSLTIASTADTALAPGVTETSVVAYQGARRIQYWVVDCDVSNGTTMVKANYHDNDNTGVWGKATVVEQANAAKAKRGYNVVASMNASYYNVSTGQPSGAFVMEGVNLNGNAAGNSWPFFAALDDGTYMVGKTGEWNAVADHVVEAVGGHDTLVTDGAVVAGLDASSLYPRAAVGVKADGNVVLLLADGNQGSYSAGMTLAEQAQLLLEVGCVEAMRLDEGGSATYAAKPEGSDEIEVRNSCCDGAVRSVSNSIMVITTAVGDGTFDHANLSTEYAYYAPNSEVAINAVGADSAGGAADLPEDLAWSLSDDSFGTVDDGVFTSTGALGTVTVNALYDDEVVGSVDVTVVNPTSVAFSANEKTVPYGKNADFTITAMYNGAQVYAAPDAFDFVVTAGTLDGFMYTAPADEAGAPENGTVTATYKYDNLASIAVAITFGKGSEVLFDFEDGDVSEWLDWRGMEQAIADGRYTGEYTMPYNGIETNYTTDASNFVAAGIKEGTFLATRDNGGKVHSGDYALGYTFDYTQGASFQNWMYGYLYYIGDKKVFRDVENGITGTRIGMWMYIPEEAVGSCSRLSYTYKDANGNINTAYLYFTYQYVSKGFSKLTSDKIPEAGWAYVYCDLDDISSTYVSTSYYKNPDGSYTRQNKPVAANYAPAFIQWIVSSSAKGAEAVTFYIDDITLDYSSAVDDRDAPIISNPLALEDQESHVLNGGAVQENVLSFSADAVEDTTHNPGNATGIDAASAKVYIDGQEVDAKFAAGKITTNNVTLPNGVHDISFEIADKQGNVSKLTKQITIDADTDYPVVSLVGEAVGGAKVKTGGQYNLLINTDQAEKIDSITTTIWLNSASEWALENATAAQGFSYDYDIDERAFKATITIENDGSTLTGAQTLLSIPVYAWAWDGSAGHDAHTQWTSGAPNGDGATCPAVTISYKAFLGEVEYVNGTVSVPKNYIAGFSNIRQDVTTELDSGISNLKNTIGEWHYHTEVAVPDKDATCTEGGYTGRTMCSDPDCNSILDWGTVIPAAGHDYQLVDGQFICSVCEDEYPIGNGLFTVGGKNYFGLLGELASGWQMAGDDWYYFDPATFEGVDGVVAASAVGVNVNGSYTFDNGRVDKGVWYNDGNGTRYYNGPEYYHGRAGVAKIVEIDGDTYAFDTPGYRYEGISTFCLSQWVPPECWVMDADGKFIEKYNGIYGDYYYIDGAQTAAYYGLVEFEGNYYYISDYAKKIKDRDYFITTTNDLTFPNGSPIKKATYHFDEDGKMVIRQGLVDGVYYVNGVPTSYAGLIEVDGDYYYISDYAQPVKGKSYFITNLNDLTFPDGTPITKGTYEFDADGKMVIKQGLYDGIYYANGKPMSYAGLIKQDGNYYYISDYARPIAGKSYFITNLNDQTFPDGTPIAKGTYEFDADGKMIIKQGLIDGVYYLNGKVQPYAGLIYQDGNYYYISDHGRPIANKEYYISNTNGLTFADGTPIPKGKYAFDADGVMQIAQ